MYVFEISYRQLRRFYSIHSKMRLNFVERDLIILFLSLNLFLSLAAFVPMPVPSSVLTSQKTDSLIDS